MVCTVGLCEISPVNLDLKIKQKCPFLSAKKWHFGCRNKTSQGLRNCPSGQRKALIKERFDLKKSCIGFYLKKGFISTAKRCS